MAKKSKLSIAAMLLAVAFYGCKTPDDAILLRDDEKLVIHDVVNTGTTGQNETVWDHEFVNSKTTSSGKLYLRQADEEGNRTEAVFLVGLFPYQIGEKSSLGLTADTPADMGSPKLNATSQNWDALDYMVVIGSFIVNANQYVKYWEAHGSIWVATYENYTVDVTVTDDELAAPYKIKPQYKFSYGGSGVPYHMSQEGDYWRVEPK